MNALGIGPSIRPGDLITPAYRASQIYLHAQPNGYGGKGDKWAPAVRELMARFCATSLLDYGCGEGSLVKALSVDKPSSWRLAEYDPGVPDKAAMPMFADLVTCTDVLEHVEPERLHVVLRHLRMLARKAIFVVVATRPSNKTLPDGRNAHLIVESAQWWEARFRLAGFTVSSGPESPLKKPSREIVAILTEAA